MATEAKRLVEPLANPMPETDSRRCAFCGIWLFADEWHLNMENQTNGYQIRICAACAERGQRGALTVTGIQPPPPGN
jgi:hypothetical protein